MNDTNLPAINSDTVEPKAIGVFSSAENFETAQRMANALSKSDLIPKAYHNNVANCLIVLEMSHRLNASPLVVAQNLNIIHGRPSWSSTYIISSINSCGRFTPLKFKMSGVGEKRACVAYATEISTGEVIEGPEVSMSMAKAEGWIDKPGSKWKTMPELMLQYRAASFFGRLHVSNILLGMQSTEEVKDVIDVKSKAVVNNAAAEINEKLKLGKPVNENKIKKMPVEPAAENDFVEPEPDESHF